MIDQFEKALVSYHLQPENHHQIQEHLIASNVIVEIKVDVHMVVNGHF